MILSQRINSGCKHKSFIRVGDIIKFDDEELETNSSINKSISLFKRVFNVR